ncbi:MAG: ABC transporter ATP-binding protein [Prochlorothrix sp.]
MLSIEALWGGYVAGLDILQGVSLEVAPGEIVTVIGANGAGKSTLAKAVVGLVRCHRGVIRFQGEPIQQLPSPQIIQRGLAYVPQVSNVFPSLTIVENLDMGAWGQSSGQLRQHRDRVFALFPRLRDRSQQRAGTLSGGERQMLAMGRALMGDPKLLVLDEPSAALSPALVDQVLAQIRQIQATGTAILLIEQNARKALALADRGCVMDQGRDRLTGTAATLLEDPQVQRLYLGGDLGG